MTSTHCRIVWGWRSVIRSSNISAFPTAILNLDTPVSKLYVACAEPYRDATPLNRSYL